MFKRKSTNAQGNGLHR